MNALQFQRQILCYSDQIYRMARSILKDEQKAEDVYQDLMLRLWERRQQLEQIENRRAFLLTSARNMCIDQLRKEPVNEAIPAAAEEDSPDPYQMTAETDMLSYIHHLIDGLPEMQRTIIRMKDVEDLEIAEIADILSISENAVTVNLSRARKKLREMISTSQHQEEKRHQTDRNMHYNRC